MKIPYPSYLFVLALLLQGATYYACLPPSEKNAPRIEYSQQTPSGTVFLFKKELDSNNIQAAMRLLAHPSGRRYLAVETYELYDEVARLQRLIACKDITIMKAQVTAENEQSFAMEFGYLKKLSLTTAKIEGEWYITTIAE